MKKYECMYITDVQLGEDKKTSLVELIKSLINDNAGEIVDSVDLGRRKLAYLVKKKSVGNYSLVTFNGENSTVAAMNERLHYDDRLLRYMITKIEK